MEAAEALHDVGKLLRDDAHAFNHESRHHTDEEHPDRISPCLGDGRGDDSQDNGGDQFGKHGHSPCL
ncbi:hypothetical protein D3C83_79460 [compost metagenome]